MTSIYQICTRCVMDTTDPNIQFDVEGVCNHCHVYDRIIARNVLSGAAGQQAVEKIVYRLKQAGRNKPYDCVIGLSGGVDSTFVAYKVKEFGLRPLAVHLDNGWDSEPAVKNIEQVCRKLNIDLQTIVLDWEEFKDLQLAFLKAGTPDLEIPSDHAIVSAMLQTAAGIGVEHIVAGYNTRTESHLPAAWSQGHYDWGYIRSVHQQFGAVALKTFPHLKRLDFYTRPWQRKFIHILNYLDYSKKEAMPVLERELGWQYYGGKHYESIYTRWYQGCWLPQKFGYDKRRTHFSSLICSGEMERAEALDKLLEPAYPPALQEADIAYVIKKFDLTEAEYTQLLQLPPKSYWDYSTYGREWLYQSMRSIYRGLMSRQGR